VEEITVQEEPFEIEFEIEEEAFEGSESGGEAPPAGVDVKRERALPAEPAPKDEPQPQQRVAAEERAAPPPPAQAEAPPPSPIAEPPVEESRRESPAARDDAMRRVKQSGGESRLLRDVKLHFKLRDWEGAVPLLEQLVQISPGSALYRGMLARAMSKVPMIRKDAEEHFIEALRLAPHDAELHYWLGLYYKSFGLKSRALTEFRTTLRIDPRHDGARKQLGGGGRKDDAIGTVFKKIFG
jgi:tetratricopeptide (TPR) repeat protein